MKENEDEKNYNIKINIYGEDIDLKINSNYDLFCKNICLILKISSQVLNEIILSYYDVDGDHIKLSSEDDYEIFLDQVKDKTVTKLKVEINENSKIDAIKCLSDALIYQENHSKEYLDDDDNDINKDNNNNDINIIEIRNDNDNNNQIINKIDNKNNDDYIINNHIDNQIINEEKPINNNNDNEKIDDLVYYYRCSSCDIYPIVCIMHYCPECTVYLCDNCRHNLKNHKHPIIKIESKKQLIEIKEKENDKIDKIKKINENLDENDNEKDNEKHDKNEEKKGFFGNFIDYLTKPFKDNKNKKQIINDKNKEPGNAPKNLDKQMKYLKIIRKARETYDLDGVKNEDLLNCLELTNGDFDKAILLLYK